MSMNLVTLLYLVASVFFIQALKGLSHPTTSIRGNIFGMTGMAIAVLTTAALIVELSGGKALGMVWVLGGLVVGGAVGAMLAAALTETTLGKSMGVLAVALAAVNVFGGFLVTRRMLEMFRKKDKKAAPAAAKAEGH